MLYKAPRGTSDLLPQDQKYWRFVENKAIEISRSYGYSRLDTPVLEDFRLFARSVGEGTDIVDKETYSFVDRGGDKLTLRPEGTAPICRAYLEHGMANWPQPVRLQYFCPVFRYDRPQAGRYREHHQFGIESLGYGDPSVDVEVIELACRFVESLGLTNTSLLINSIGDPKCRPGYIMELKRFYSNKLAELCDDCKGRWERNPLRLLDCKNNRCQTIGLDSPRSSDYLCNECQDHWYLVKGYLDTLKIQYTVDHRLVRGLDYYTRSVFEIQPAKVGAQSTICGGGRYDGLIELLGGKPTPGIGFAAGIERLVMNLKQEGIHVPEEHAPEYLVANIGQETREYAIRIASTIRNIGVSTILGSEGRSLKGQLRHANSLGVSNVIIVGNDELEREHIAIRSMDTGTQQSKPIDIFMKELESTQL